MSDDIVHVIDLSTDADDAPHRAEAIYRWLVAERVIDAAPTGDPAGCHAGGERRWLVDGDSPADTTPFEVELAVGRTSFDATEAVAPLRCPACGHQDRITNGAQFDAVVERVLADLETWESGKEPDATCSACGHTAPLGDWPNPSVAVGHLAVSIHRHEIVDPAFLAALKSRLGARVVVLHQHS